MPDRGGVIPRRLLGAELRKLREDAGYKLEDLARELLISTSKLSRLENAQGLPQLRDIRDLIRFYRIGETVQESSLLHWTEQSRRAPWWKKISAPVPAATAEYLAFESAASEIHGYAAHFVPSLLQLPDYARELIRAINDPEPHELEPLVALRLSRQEIITRKNDRAHLDIVIDESALLRRTGSDDIMHAQLKKLATIAEQELNVTLRVLELHSGPQWAAFRGTFSVFRFPNGMHPDVANPEDVDKYLDDSEQAHDFLDRFDALCDKAADPDHSVTILRRLARQYSGLTGDDR